MTVPTGPASLADIQAEFGGTNPISLDEYYAGGPYVPNPPPTSAYQTGPIPTSGPISIGNFLGVTKIVNFVFNDVVSSNLNGGYNLRNRAVAAGWNGTYPLIATITINSGVYVFGTQPMKDYPDSTPYTPAFTLGSMPAGSTITMTNNGYIVGAGGQGDKGTSTVNGVAIIAIPSGGQAGYNGVDVNYPITIANYGLIAGGGGGGGAGCNAGLTPNYGAAGGAGAGGAPNGLHGPSGVNTGSPSDRSWFGTNGTNATSTTAGSAGGSLYPEGNGWGGYGPYGPESGPGGAGGYYGQPGQPGIQLTGAQFGEHNSEGVATAGGAAGPAVVGGSNITWTNYGQRYGSIDNPGTWGGAPQHVVQLQNDYIYDYQISPSNASVGLGFYTDGTMSWYPNSDVQQTAWFFPVPNTGIGSNYWIRATLLSGSQPSGPAFNTWLSLSSQRNWSLSFSSFSGAAQGYFRIEISDSSSGSNILTSALFNLEATVDA